MCEIIDPDVFFEDFPALDRNVLAESRATLIYKCIAHALGYDDNCWWPSHDTYWPRRCPREATTQAFECAFATEGYTPCDNGGLEDGFEKIALYAKNEGECTHAARQRRNGRWTSKCGGNVDLEHELGQLEGPCYGKVVRFFRRPMRGG